MRDDDRITGLVLKWAVGHLKSARESSVFFFSFEAGPRIISIYYIIIF